MVYMSFKKDFVAIEVGYFILMKDYMLIYGKLATFPCCFLIGAGTVAITNTFLYKHYYRNHQNYAFLPLSSPPR